MRNAAGHCPEFQRARRSRKKASDYIDRRAAHEGAGPGSRRSRTRSSTCTCSNNDKSFYKMVCRQARPTSTRRISDCDDSEVRMLTEEFVSSILPMQLRRTEQLHHAQERHQNRRKRNLRRQRASVVRFYISMIKRTRGTDYYNRYAHTIVRIVETAFTQTELERERNGAARHIALQGLRDGEQGARNLRRRPHQLDQRTDDQVRRHFVGTAGAGTHAHRDGCQETRISVPQDRPYRNPKAR